MTSRNLCWLHHNRVRTGQHTEIDTYMHVQIHRALFKSLQVSLVAGAALRSTTEWARMLKQIISGFIFSIPLPSANSGSRTRQNTPPPFFYSNHCPSISLSICCIHYSLFVKAESHRSTEEEEEEAGGGRGLLFDVNTSCFQGVWIGQGEKSHHWWALMWKRHQDIHIVDGKEA